MRTRVLPLFRAIAPALLGVLCLLAPAPCRAQPLRHPHSVAVDLASNVYVTEPERHSVKKFDANGMLLLRWGTRGSANSQFEFPRGIAVDAGGTAVYVADSGNHRIQKFTIDGEFMTAWGSFGNQNGQFVRPTGIALDAAGDVLVTDSVTGRVQEFTNTGGIVRAWGGVFGAGDGQFGDQGPQGIAVDPGGNILVVDRSNHRIMQFDSNGGFLGWAGGCTGGPGCDVSDGPGRGQSKGIRCSQMTCLSSIDGVWFGQFTAPTALSVTSNGVYVTDLSNRIQLLTGQGVLLAWGFTGSGPGQLQGPSGLAVVAGGPVVYVADAGNNRIQRLNPADINPQTAWTGWGNADIRLQASDGAAPGFVNPIVLAGMSTKSSRITVTSLNGFAGPVDLSVSCCGSTNRAGGDTPGTVATLSAAQVIVPANGGVAVRLDLSRPTALGSPDKWFALITATNTAQSVEQVQSVVFTVPQPPGANFALAAVPGRTPGIADLFATRTGTSSITVTSAGAFDGPVSLAATCCFDVLAGGTVTGSGITATLSQQSVVLRPGAPATSTLTVTTANPPAFGKFLMTVTGTNAEIGNRSTTAAFTVLPPLIAGPTTCRPASLETLSMRDALRLLIGRKETPTNSPTFVIGVIPRADLSNAVSWTVTVAENPLLSADEALIVLDNATGDIKEITTAGGCGSRSVAATSGPGQTSSMIIRKVTERTLVFRRMVGPHFPDGQRRWEEMFVISEAAFWHVFGGRTTTFRWIHK